MDSTQPEQITTRKSASKIGCQLAEELYNHYKTRSPLELAELLKVRIIEEKHERGIVGDLVICAAYEPEIPAIRVYSDSLDLLKTAMEETGVVNEFPDPALLCIAHELFHHLERIQSVETPDSEASAHAFVKELLGLDRSPDVLNALLTIISA